MMYLIKGQSLSCTCNLANYGYSA